MLLFVVDLVVHKHVGHSLEGLVVFEEIFVEQEICEAKLIESHEVLLALLVRSILLIDTPGDFLSCLRSLFLSEWLILLLL